MDEHAHAKSGKAFQRPSTLIQFSPVQITLHENIMFDYKTSDATKRIRGWHQRVHSRPYSNNYNCYLHTVDLKL